MDYIDTLNEPDNCKLKVAFFPWLAFGHMIPFLELAKEIALKGHRVTFISTPRNIDRLLSNVPPRLASTIEFLRLPLPLDENLPPNAEATSDVLFFQVPFLKKAFDGLQEGLASFLEANQPDWIVYDFVPHWLPPIATKLGVAGAFYNIITSWTVCMFGSSSEALIKGSDRTEYEDYISPPKWIPFSTNLCYRNYEAKRMFGGLKVDVSGVSDGYRLGMVLMGSDLLVSRSCNELDFDWLKLLGELHQKPVVPVGLLPPCPQDGLDNNEEKNAWNDIGNWLDKMGKGSVVYIALGSEVPLSQEVVNELACGVELSGLPFFWALRIQDGSVELPEGFKGRTVERGMVWTKWAPQVKILAHQSIGGFLTHCGWGSLIEGLQFGRPLVMLPWFLDQGLNARFFQGKNVGVEIPRSEDDGLFTKEGIAESMRKVMATEGDNIYLENARQMQEIFGNREIHDKYVDNFLNYLVDHKVRGQGTSK